MVHGKPRHSQSQGSVERGNRDIEARLSTAIADINISLGLPSSNDPAAKEFQVPFRNWQVTSSVILREGKSNKT